MSDINVLLVAEGTSDVRRIEVLLRRRLSPHAVVLTDFDGDRYLALRKIPALHDAMFARARFSSDRHSKAPGDRASLRKLMAILKKRRLDHEEALVVWCRDSDGDADRAVAAQEVRAATPEWHGRWWIAVPHECSEGWVIRGLDALPDRRTRLRAWKDAGRPDPRGNEHLLSHKRPHQAKHSAKGLLEALGLDADEEEACLLHAADEVTADDRTGLRAFLDDVDAWIAED